MEGDMFWKLVLVACSGWLALGAEVEPASEQILRKLAAEMSAARTAEVDLQLSVKVREQMEESLSLRYDLAVERPNKLALRLKEGTLGASVISDGTNTVTYVPALKAYTSKTAPADFSGIELDSKGARGDLGSMAFLAALFSADPYRSLLAGVNSAASAGREKIGGIDCNRINLKQEGLDWTLFTTTGENPRVRRIEVVIPQMTMSMDFTDWKLNTSLARDKFLFAPPEGAKKVGSLVSDPEEEGEDSELVGENLPSFKLKTIDGDAFDTAGIKGKTAILVAWSGEAEHCVNALRASYELAAANQDVAFHSINIDENPDKTRIKNLLARHKLPAKTALDQDHRAVEELELDGVPTTFLIDKKGVVRKAFLGYHPDFKSVVAAELKKLE